MTIEQLKNNQEDLHYRTNEVLIRLETIVSKIIGEYREVTPEVKEEAVRLDRGPIGDIELQQQFTLCCIKNILETLNRLEAHTYNPIEVECKQALH